MGIRLWMIVRVVVSVSRYVCSVLRLERSLCVLLRRLGSLGRLTFVYDYSECFYRCACG